jgi:hypothetical protein
VIAINDKAIQRARHHAALDLMRPRDDSPPPEIR